MMPILNMSEMTCNECRPLSTIPAFHSFSIGKPCIMSPKSTFKKWRFCRLQNNFMIWKKFDFYCLNEPIQMCWSSFTHHTLLCDYHINFVVWVVIWCCLKAAHLQFWKTSQVGVCVDKENAKWNVSWTEMQVNSKGQIQHTTVCPGTDVTPNTKSIFFLDNGGIWV